MTENDPGKIRYGLWRLHALRLAAAGETWTVKVQSDLRVAGFNIVLGTLAPALDQFVRDGLLWRDPARSPAQRRPFRITPQGLDRLRVLRDVVADSLTDIEAALAGKPSVATRKREQPPRRRTLRPTADYLLRLLGEIEASNAALRRVLEVVNRMVEQALGTRSLTEDPPRSASGEVVHDLPEPSTQPA